MREGLIGFVGGAFGAVALCAAAAYFLAASPESRMRKVQTYQMPAIQDLSQAPTKEDYNHLLKVLRQARLMKEPDITVHQPQPPASDWLHWWPFPHAKAKSNSAP